MDQLIQVLGSLLILTAFIAAQRGLLSTESRVYLTLNLVGAGILAVIAAYERQLGYPRPRARSSRSTSYVL